MANRQASRWSRLAIRLWGDTRGDVLLEYVLLTVLIVVPLVGVNQALFNPSGINPDTGQRALGPFGEAFVGFYQRLVCGIGLPVP